MKLPSWTVWAPRDSNLRCELVEEGIRDVEHALQRSDRHPLVGLVVSLRAVGEVRARKALGLERVGVRPAARGDPRGLVAARPQRLLGGEHGRRLLTVAVAAEQPLHDEVDVALA